ncbi:MAG: glycosyltransferase [Candidatus Omnitrophica bacterium]|nr:glycosyltransferase [Candidatus Omnitrophota bacterium]
MVAAVTNPLRVSADGKFFQLRGQKFYVKGIAYGPVVPNGRGEPFASPGQVARDFEHIRDLGANVVRVYYPPPRWLLDEAVQHELRLLIDIPWSQHVCFLDSASGREDARRAIRQAAQICASHPGVFALSVANEIPPDVVRWSGARAVADFIDELIDIVKGIDSECLCTYGNYPPTEFLNSKEADFLCYNVYLHHPKPFRNYLARLQMIADTKPLVLGEFGIDSLREGEARQAEMLGWQIESVFSAGLAGGIVYSYTDEWFRGEVEIFDWAFGLTRRNREPKPAFGAVQEQFGAAPYYPLNGYPPVSVVVACYNGARTLKVCLESLERLYYPDYEVIVVDDGSTDSTAQIAASFNKVRLVKHPKNLGLSTARNTGIAAARGEIVAFTDADCRADQDWLYYLVGGLQNRPFAAMGGPNLLPPDDSCVAATVMVSPGGPSHVMLTDQLAEHIPGCNMAIYRWALDELGGFDPVFRRAGDDVDVCWRLQQMGYKIGFSPAAFVWHYRRSTVADYLRQQRGYGEAEALLVRKHPARFSWFGGGIWHGRIYSAAKFGVVLRRPRIYYGLFGSGFFQSLYRGQPEFPLLLLTSLEHQVLVTLPLCVLAVAFPFLAPLALASLLAPVAMSIAAAVQAELPAKKRRFWSRPLVALLFYLQPLARGWARYQGRLSPHSKPLSAHENLDSLTLKARARSFRNRGYWVENGIDRLGFLKAVLEELDKEGWQSRTDEGWNNFDVEIAGNRWSRLKLITVAEAHRHGNRLLRCRLSSEWTFLAKTVFFVALGGELLGIGFWGATPHWHWLLLASLAGLVWWLRRQCRDLERLVAAFLDAVAKRLALIKIEPVPSPPAVEKSQPTAKKWLDWRQWFRWMGRAHPGSSDGFVDLVAGTDSEVAEKKPDEDR